MPICPLHNAARRRLYLREQAETKWRRTICYKKHSDWRFPSKLCVENYCAMTYGNIVSCSVFKRFWIRHWLKVNVAGQHVSSILVRLWIWQSSSALKIDKNCSRMLQQCLILKKMGSSAIKNLWGLNQFLLVIPSSTATFKEITQNALWNSWKRRTCNLVYCVKMFYTHRWGVEQVTIYELVLTNMTMRSVTWFRQRSSHLVELSHPIQQTQWWFEFATNNMSTKAVREDWLPRLGLNLFLFLMKTFKLPLKGLNTKLCSKGTR